MHPGIYTFYNQATGRYLSWEDTQLVLRSSPKRWQLKQDGNGHFYVYAHQTDLLMDIDNAWIVPGNTIKIWQLTGYDVQIWTIARNANGTYSILYSGDNRYCLGFDGGKAVLQVRTNGNSMQEWKVTEISVVGQKEYLSVFSESRVVELQLPMGIKSVITVPHLQCWADRLEIAYGAFCELTGFRPFENVVVEAYKPNNYPNYGGWVFPNSNEIHIDREFIFEELKKMRLRHEDWNFCALHEMGHLFDFGKPWNFEAELMTDLKVAYVMEKTGAVAAPAEFNAFTCFRGADIAKAYAALAAPFSEQYNIFGCTKRFLDIKNDIGWEAFRQTFHYLQKNSQIFKNISCGEKLITFVGMLTRYSGRDVKAYFTDREWHTILRHVEKKA